ncbi:response regulator [Ensifer soli]|uniref:response regulator n=1 Tax=Ciceribacter sp. sgz301302 TaxID=3342379 RepID=UPI0035B87BFA
MAPFEPATSTMPVKFLLVDDLEENLVAMEALLARDGLELIRARSGAEALELLLKHEVGLALLDVQMPEMDGFELAELMRGTERTRHIPIIFVTALPADERRRFRGYEMGAVDYLQKPIDPQVIASKTHVFFELARQRRELAAKAEALTAALGELEAHTDNSPLAFVRFSADLAIAGWSEGAIRLFGWSAREAIGRRPEDLGWLDAEAAALFAAAASGLVAGQAAARRTVLSLDARDKAGGRVAGEWYLSVLPGRDGRAPFSAQILDVTERHRAEETQRLLIGELNHRVKNTLATVQAIATQTFRHTRGPETFNRTFTGRLQALSKAHSLLSARTWEGACLAELVREQLSLGALDPARVAVAGPEVKLKPQQALQWAMILHELATNAVKYGAHSVPSGRLSVTWRVADGLLSIEWRERGGPPPEAGGRRGFGTTLIETSARTEGGEAVLETMADGLVWRISMAVPDDALVAFDRAVEAETAAVAPQAEPAPPARKRILIIEDEPLVALDLEATLAERGYEISATATSVKEALEAMQDAAIDLALLDGNLRGDPVDGVAGALADRAIPFVFVSGYGRENLPVDFDDIPIIEKPFNPDELLRRVDSMIGRAV